MAKGKAGCGPKGKPKGGKPKPKPKGKPMPMMQPGASYGPGSKFT